MSATADGSRGTERSGQAAADYVRNKWPLTPRAGIILGTGLGRLAEHVRQPVPIPFREVPEFPQATALGHKGQLVCGTLAGIPVVVCEGRLHLYEGYSVGQVALPVTVFHRLGAELLVISNASGGLHPVFRSGDIMAIADHINLMGSRTGSLANCPTDLPSRSGGPSPYDPALIELAQEMAREDGFPCHAGTYVSVLGPNYETRAEYRALRRLGGDAVGMSTVPEALAAVRCGMRVLALSTITNVARPDILAATAGSEVIDAAATAEPRLRTIVLGVLARIFPVEVTR